MVNLIMSGCTGSAFEESVKRHDIYIFVLQVEYYQLIVLSVILEYFANSLTNIDFINLSPLTIVEELIINCEGVFNLHNPN